MENSSRKLKIKDYSEYPGPRYCSQGEKSGEDFYFSCLNSAFADVYQSGGKLEIILDGVAGYASSFLDEAFGNLVYDFERINVINHIKIVSIEEPDWIDMIQDQSMNEWEQRRIKNEAPEVTTDHEVWYHLRNGKIESGIWRVKL